MGEEAVGALASLEGVPDVLPVLPLSLLGLGFSLDLWGAFGADFRPGPSIGHHCQQYVWRRGLLLRIRLIIPLKHPVFRSLLGHR